MTLLLLPLLACASPPEPTSLDIEGALAPLCEDDDPVEVAFDDLAVYEGPAPELAVNLRVSPTELVVDGMEVSLADLEDVLGVKAETAREIAQKAGSAEFAFRGELLLLVAASTPGSVLVPVVERAGRAGFEELRFVGRSAEERAPVVYADPAFAQQLEATNDLPPERRAKAYDALSDGLIDGCAPLVEAMEAVALAAPEHKCVLAQRALAEALPACDSERSGEDPHAVPVPSLARAAPGDHLVHAARPGRNAHGGGSRRDVAAAAPTPAGGRRPHGLAAPDRAVR